ncbi:hypothetical protein B0O95_102140 [Mycetohabitans endofungorum]|uniref:Uncharacterized protein n=1 Tax=Mycetohabitans endofungorum TaxID=417203 RepID=A0A2P5KDF6_9BURK|nr:hypothetical protein B0O95_102140 [Mycetohabitans endofungorum]
MPDFPDGGAFATRNYLKHERVRILLLKGLNPDVLINLTIRRQ